MLANKLIDSCRVRDWHGHRGVDGGRVVEDREGATFAVHWAVWWRSKGVGLWDGDGGEEQVVRDGQLVLGLLVVVFLQTLLLQAMDLLLSEGMGRVRGHRGGIRVKRAQWVLVVEVHVDVALVVAVAEFWAWMGADKGSRG